MISRLLDVARDRAGAAMVEFAIVLPLLAIVLLGILQFGIFFYDYVQVEDATAIGERQFLASRVLGQAGTTSPCPAAATPYSSTRTAIQQATNLPTSEITITLSVGGTACTTDSGCCAALNTAYSTTGAYATAQTASVTVSYPCLTLLPVSWVPANFCPGGLLTSTMTQRVD
jgi:Flp pilus assembly protein TadG